jgi:hypothetical protein
VMLELNLGSTLVPTNDSVAGTRIFLRECQGGSHRRQRFRSGQKNKKGTSSKLKERTLALVPKTSWGDTSLLTCMIFSLREFISDQNLDQGSNFSPKIKVSGITSKQMGV